MDDLEYALTPAWRPHWPRPARCAARSAAPQGDRCLGAGGALPVPAPHRSGGPRTPGEPPRRRRRTSAREELRQWEGHHGGGSAGRARDPRPRQVFANQVRFSREGDLVATASKDGAVKVWIGGPVREPRTCPPPRLGAGRGLRPDGPAPCLVRAGRDALGALAVRRREGAGPRGAGGPSASCSGWTSM